MNTKTMDVYDPTSIEVERHFETSTVKLNINKNKKKKAAELIGAGAKSRS